MYLKLKIQAALMELSQLSKADFAIIRYKLNMTTDELAELMRIPEATIRAYESGRIKIPGVVSEIMKHLEKEDEIINLK